MTIIQHLATFLKRAYNPSNQATPERASGLKRGFGTNIIGGLDNSAAGVAKQNKPAKPQVASAAMTVTAAWKLATDVGGEPNIFKTVATATKNRGKQLGQQIQQSGQKMDTSLKWQGRRANAGRMVQSGVAGLLGQQSTPGQTLTQGLSQAGATHQNFQGARQNVQHSTQHLRRQALTEERQQANQFRAVGNALGNVGQPQTSVST